MHYETSDISELSYRIEGGTLSVAYSLPLDTLYYSPGVDVSDSSNDTLIRIKKCSVDKKCTVGIPTNQIDGNKAMFILNTTRDPSKIYVNQVHEENSLSALIHK